MFNLTSPGEVFPDEATELRVMNVRLRISQAFSLLMEKAVDAAINHNINYRTLPAYKDTALLNEGSNLPYERGQEKFLEWIRRVDHDITAAIRRKSFRKLENPTHG